MQDKESAYDIQYNKNREKDVCSEEKMYEYTVSNHIKTNK